MNSERCAKPIRARWKTAGYIPAQYGIALADAVRMPSDEDGYIGASPLASLDAVHAFLEAIP
jgi:hypothetical protein